jgi:hypothetical protein
VDGVTVDIATVTVDVAISGFSHQKKHSVELFLQDFL